MDRSSTHTHAATTAGPESAPAFLPQYGFGKTYSFDELVDQHPFLYRVHTPRRRDRDRATSRATSPNPSRPSTPFRPQLSRASSLSASASSVRHGNSGPGMDDDDSAPGDPYFISRRFRDDLSSPDVHVRRRTLSTLSSLSGGSDVGTYIGSDYEYDFSDAESDVGTAVSSTGLSRSASMMLGPRRKRIDSLIPSRPRSKRSASLGHVSFALDGNATPPRPITPLSIGAENVESPARPVDMTYADLQRHLDWTTRSQSPYVTTSFSFFWALWEAVRRYRLGVKHDVEIAVVDARRLRGRARTALEVLRGVEQAQQDKAYWKWYRFALEAQDVLVFGAIPGDAIYASTPLTQILAALPEYCFRSEVPKSMGPAGQTGDDDIKENVDPRSPTAHQVQPSFFPVTPDRRTLSGSMISGMSTPSHERAMTADLIARLAWDIGTTMKPPRKPAAKSLSSSTSSAQSLTGTQGPRYTSHRLFCHALESAFLSPSRPDAARVSDSTVGAVRLASLLISPWLRATCAEGAGLFGEDEDDDSDDDAHMHGSECLGLAGDGCALESMHSSTATVERPMSRRDYAMREVEETLSELAAALARWPAGWWTAEHVDELERLRSESVHTCVTEAASGARARAGWALANELGRMVRGESANADAEAGETDRRGRGTSRSRSPEREQETDGHGQGAEKARMPFPMRRAGSSSPSPYKPRARSPLGLAPAMLGPAIVLKGKHEGKTASEPGIGRHAQEWDSSVEDLPASLTNSLYESMSRFGTPGTPGREETEREVKGETEETWQPHTPPPTPPPRSLSSSEGSVSASAEKMSRKRTPPPPPPPRSIRRPSSPSSLPGEWPGEGVIAQDASPSPSQSQTQASSQPQRPRPFSWIRQGSAGSGASSPLGGSRTSSTESLRASISGSGSAPGSGSARLRGDARAALLGEVLQAALGLGVVEGGVDTQGSGSALKTGSESPGRPMHHRRHSSQLTLEQELSPVREEMEAEAALDAALEKLEKLDARDSMDGSVSTKDDNKDPFADGNSVVDAATVPEVAQAPAVRERSATLESIPEEGWSIIDVPISAVPSVANGEAEGKENIGEKDDLKPKAEANVEPVMQEEASSLRAREEDTATSAPVETTFAPPMENSSAGTNTDLTLMYTEKLIVPSPPPSPRPSQPPSITPPPFWKLPFLRLLKIFGIRSPASVANAHTTSAIASSPVFEDPSYSLARSSSWAMSCFVCGVMASLLVASAQTREIVFANQFT